MALRRTGTVHEAVRKHRGAHEEKQSARKLFASEARISETKAPKSGVAKWEFPDGQVSENTGGIARIIISQVHFSACIAGGKQSRCFLPQMTLVRQRAANWVKPARQWLDQYPLGGMVPALYRLKRGRNCCSVTKLY